MDLTLGVFESIEDFELLVHGIAISPGKPTIIAKAGQKPIIGLPGQVSSAFIVAEVFMSRLIKALSGEKPSDIMPLIDAVMTRNIESASGREDYLRVRLLNQGKEIFADPILGKSGLISPLVEADGLVRIDINKEGLYKGERVKVIPFISKGALW
jgi:molybdopterin molybdotransferase